MVGLGADRVLGRRVVDHQVGIGAHGHHALARVQPEHPGRGGGDHLYPALAGEPAGQDATVVKEIDPILHARQPVRDLPEVAPPELLLAVEIEGAMVGGHDLEIVLDQAVPQVHLVIGRAQRRRAHELGPVEAVAHVVERQEQVLRAGFREHPAAPVARRPDLVQRLARREVYEVQGHARCLGQPDRAVRGLALEDRIAGDAVVVGIGVAGRDLVPGNDVDGHPVLGVNHDQAAIPGGLLERPVDLAVVAVEDARIGGEELEVWHALGNQAVHLGQGRVVDVAHDHVESVVDDRVALRLGVPGVEALAQ